MTQSILLCRYVPLNGVGVQLEWILNLWHLTLMQLPFSGSTSHTEVSRFKWSIFHSSVRFINHFKSLPLFELVLILFYFCVNTCLMNSLYINSVSSTLMDSFVGYAYSFDVLGKFQFGCPQFISLGWSYACLW